MPGKPELRPALVDLLAGPSLPAAACAGRSELFDPPPEGEPEDDTAYRQRAAARVCSTCPTWSACRRAAEDFARLEGAAGFVVAGLIVTPRRTLMPTPADHLEAASGAVALVQLAERGDNDAFRELLAGVVHDPEDAGATLYGLVQLVRATLSLAGVHGDARIELLDGLAVDTARERGE